MIIERDNSHEHATINALIAKFYAAFDNRSGRAIDVDGLRRMFVAGSVIVRTGCPDIETMTVESFIAPRARMLCDGSLTEFHEWETSENTQVLRDIACRHSTYAKTGLFQGEPCDGSGAKLMQLVRTRHGWRIAAISWEEDRQ